VEISSNEKERKIKNRALKTAGGTAPKFLKSTQSLRHPL